MLSNKQYFKLRRIQVFGGTTAKDYEKFKDTYQFFLSKGYIKRGDVRGYNGFVILPEGEQELFVTRAERFRFWVPTAISLIALLTAILSLSTTAPDVWKAIAELLIKA